MWEEKLFAVVGLRRRDGLDHLAVDMRVGLVGVEPDLVVAGAAIEGVDLVVARERVEDVVAVASELDIGAATDEEPVAARAAVDAVVTVAAADLVVSVRAVQDVVAGPALDAVVVRPAVDRVVAPAGEDPVTACCSALTESFPALARMRSCEGVPVSASSPFVPLMTLT